MIGIIFLNALGQTFFSWVWANSPQMGALLGAGCVVWWIAGRFHDHQSRISKIQSNLAQLSTTLESAVIRLTQHIETVEARLTSQVNQLRSDLNDTNGLVTSIDKKLDSMTTYLSAKGVLGPDFGKNRSPMMLTDGGMKFLVDSGGKGYIDNHVELLISKIEAKGFKTALDVQDYCTILLLGHSSDDGMIPVKEHLFANPMYKVNEVKTVQLDMMIALSTMGLYLRDKYFEKHPELWEPHKKRAE